MSPRFYMTEDGCNDISATIMMDKDLVAPLEIEDYVTVALPWLMDRPSFYIFDVVVGNMNAVRAIHVVRRDILLEDAELR